MWKMTDKKEESLEERCINKIDAHPNVDPDCYECNGNDYDCKYYIPSKEFDNSHKGGLYIPDRMKPGTFNRLIHKYVLPIFDKEK